MNDKLIEGDGYLPKFEHSREISIQIGVGGDCGVFLGDCNEETFRTKPIFRITVNIRDFRKNWRKVGNFPLYNDMRNYQIYGESETGTNNKYRVSLENFDFRTPIDKVEYLNLEPMAVWNNIHILRRLENFNRENFPRKES